MVTLVKHEWHSHDRQYAIEIDEATLGEIYPDLDKDEIVEKLKQITNGEIDVEEIINDAYDNDVEFEWEFQYDDCYSDRKGGYDVTYELGDEDSWHSDPEPNPPYIKCTKCRWTGQNKYQSTTMYLREDGTSIPDYLNSDEEHHHSKEVCPMCDSDVEFTEYGKEQELEMKKILDELDMVDDDNTN